MSTPLTTQAMMDYQISRYQAFADRVTRIRVYTTGGILIGLPGVGQGDEVLTFPANFLCGDAMKSNVWIREATTEELEQDSLWYRRLTEVEQPSKLIHQIGDVPASPDDYMGQYGDTMTANISGETSETLSFTTVPDGHGMDVELEGIKTPPTPDPFS